MFVGGGDEAKQELASGVIEWCESYFVDDDQVVATDLFDGFADGVVGHGTVKLLDEFDGGEVADLVAGGDSGSSEGDQVVAFTCPCWSDETQICCFVDPLEGDQVVVAGPCVCGLGDIELVECFDHREPCGSHLVTTVRFVTGSDFGFQECTQEFLWCPSLRFSGGDDLGG